MSKTFKCVVHEEEVLEVYPFIGEEGGRKFSLLMPHVSSNAGIAFDSTTAPALALAILEAAGYTEDDTEGTTGLTHFALAMSNLRAGFEEQERITAEAKDKAKLEAEALDFLNVMRHANGSGPMPSFESLGTLTKRDYLAIARRARELNKEATK